MLLTDCPTLKDNSSYLNLQMQDKLVDHKLYICANGQDMPEIRNWKWDE